MRDEYYNAINNKIENEEVYRSGIGRGYIIDKDIIIHRTVPSTKTTISYKNIEIKNLSSIDISRLYSLAKEKSEKQDEDILKELLTRNRTDV